MDASASVEQSLGAREARSRRSALRSGSSMIPGVAPTTALASQLVGERKQTSHFHTTAPTWALLQALGGAQAGEMNRSSPGEAEGERGIGGSIIVSAIQPPYALQVSGPVPLARQASVSSRATLLSAS